MLDHLSPSFPCIISVCLIFTPHLSPHYVVTLVLMKFVWISSLLVSPPLCLALSWDDFPSFYRLFWRQIHACVLESSKFNAWWVIHFFDVHSRPPPPPLLCHKCMWEQQQLLTMNCHCMCTVSAMQLFSCGLFVLMKESSLAPSRRVCKIHPCVSVCICVLFGLSSCLRSQRTEMETFRWRRGFLSNVPHAVAACPFSSARLQPDRLLWSCLFSKN